jgi:hypothetical protein
MTNKEIFEKVKTHLLKQKERAVIRSDAGDRCVYRDGSLMCAVGCLIPDHLYTTEIEGNSVGGLESLSSLLAWTRSQCMLRDILHNLGINKNQYPLLIYLQNIHDAEPVIWWPEKLEQCRKEFNIE